MTSQPLLWLLPGCWALAVVLALVKLTFDVLAADARGAGLSVQLLRSAVRTCVSCGAVFSCVAVFSAIFKTIDETWDLSLTPFSCDLTAYGGFVKRAVLGAGFFICLTIAHRLLDRLLDRLLPNGPAEPGW